MFVNINYVFMLLIYLLNVSNRFDVDGNALSDKQQKTNQARTTSVPRHQGPYGVHFPTSFPDVCSAIRSGSNYNLPS